MSISIPMKACSARHRVILGSGSPRRRELLSALDIEFTVDTGNSFEEIIPEGLPAEEVATYMSRGKSHGFHRDLDNDEVLITSDTVVIVGGKEVLGKPHGREDAIRMLRALSGCTHEVVTGVTVRTASGENTFSDTTTVSFREMSNSEIEYYVDTYKPFDKAGAYGIQEWIGYVAIDRIEGSFYNVMGFPVHRVWEALAALD